MSERAFKIIARINTDFTSKFSIPRQSGLIKGVKGEIVFEPEYRDDSALKGIEGFSHLWLIWEFSESVLEDWRPTVRPPRLGGNQRMGVFATRSPFRPNPVGISCVKLEEIRKTKDKGTVLIVSGVDLLNKTPIYDIKPYIPYTDSVPKALGGFSDEVEMKRVKVEIPKEYESVLESGKTEILKEILSLDPRPAYKNDDKEYSFEFADCNVKFKVENGILKVTKIQKTDR